MRRRIAPEDYVKLIRRFNPKQFDPDRILDLAESVGMEYRKKATLLTTGKTLRTSIDLLPTHWQDGIPVLSIKGLPSNLLAGETLVVKLDFDSPLQNVDESSGHEFKG